METVYNINITCSHRPYACSTTCGTVRVVRRRQHRRGAGGGPVNSHDRSPASDDYHSVVSLRGTPSAIASRSAQSGFCYFVVSSRFRVARFTCAGTSHTYFIAVEYCTVCRVSDRYTPGARATRDVSDGHRRTSSNRVTGHVKYL